MRQSALGRPAREETRDRSIALEANREKFGTQAAERGKQTCRRPFPGTAHDARFSAKADRLAATRGSGSRRWADRPEECDGTHGSGRRGITKPEHAIPAGGILTPRPRPAQNTDILRESLRAPRQRQAESAVRGAVRRNKARKFAKHGSLRAVLIDDLGRISESCKPGVARSRRLL